MLASRICQRAAPALRHRPSPIAVQIQASWHAKRIFATTPRHRKDDARARTVQKETEGQTKKPSEEELGPQGVVKTEQTSKPAPKNDPLLAEQTVSNKEQRKADWAIIKDMSGYLWPKNDFNTRFRVGLSVGLLVGAKVCLSRRVRLCQFPVLIEYIGSECTSAILFQEHCRFHEH